MLTSNEQTNLQTKLNKTAGGASLTTFVTDSLQNEKKKKKIEKLFLKANQVFFLNSERQPLKILK